VAAISLATAGLWMADQLTRWPPAVPALLALVALLAPGLGVMSWPTFARQAPWSTCLVLAAAVSLADALTRTGAAAWIAAGLFSRLAPPPGATAAGLAIFVVTAIIALAIPNRAAAITLAIPVAVAFAASSSLPAIAAGLVVLITVDVETMYPAQTAANLLAYDRGYFDARLLARVNLLMLAAGAGVIALLALPWWAWLGLA
jgi:di/tricarboxylate transporter